MTPLRNKSLEERLWPFTPCGTTHSANLEHPTRKGLPLLISVGERGELEERLSLDEMEKKAKLSAGYSQFCFVFIFKLWKGEKKSQWGGSFYFYFCSFHFFSFFSYKDGLYLSKEKNEEKVLYFLKGDGRS